MAPRRCSSRDSSRLCPLDFSFATPSEPGPRATRPWRAQVAVARVQSAALIPSRPLGVGEVTPQKSFSGVGAEIAEKPFCDGVFSEIRCTEGENPARLGPGAPGLPLARRRQAPARLLAQGPFRSKIELLRRASATAERSSGAPRPAGEAAFRRRRHPSSLPASSSAERRLKVNGDLSRARFRAIPAALAKGRRLPASLLHPPKPAISPKRSTRRQKPLLLRFLRGSSSAPAPTSFP